MKVSKQFPGSLQGEVVTWERPVADDSTLMVHECVNGALWRRHLLPIEHLLRLHSMKLTSAFSHRDDVNRALDVYS